MPIVFKSQIEQPETFTKFREKHMYRNLGMEYCNFIKIDTSTQVFSVTFWKRLRILNMQNICKRLLQKKRPQQSCFPVNFEKLLIIRFYQNTLDPHHSRQNFNPRATHASLFFCNTPKFYGSLPPTSPMQKLDPRHPLTQAPTLPTPHTLFSRFKTLYAI